MADKKIQFVVSSTGQDQVSNGFNKVDKAAQNMDRSMQAASGGTRKNSQSMIEFGRIIQDAPYGIQGVANNVTRLAETMNVGAPLLMGISLVSSALVVLMGRSRDTSVELEKVSEKAKLLRSAMLSVTKFESFLDEKSFQITKDNIDTVIHSMNNLIDRSRIAAEAFNPNDPKKGLFSGKASKDEIDKMFTSYNKLTNEATKQKNISKEVLDILKKQRDELQAQKIISEMLESIGLRAVSREDEKLAEQKRKVDKLLDGIETRINKINMMPISPIAESKFGKEEGLFTSKIMTAPKPSVGDVLDFTKGEQDLINFVDTITFSLTDTLQSGFSQAWEKIFGEANSLVEQLLSNLANGLMNLASRKAETAIFDFILGLIPGGSAVSGALSVANSGYGGNGTYTPRMQAGNTTTVIKLGDATLLKLVNGVLPQAYADNVRYREIGVVS